MKWVPMHYPAFEFMGMDIPAVAPLAVVVFFIYAIKIYTDNYK